MTQEQLAELFSISPQAVSRWETDAAMPDVSLLPPLANLFQVTTDYLLGVDIQKNEDRIIEIIKNASAEGTDEEYQQNLEEMNRLCENILAKCPDRKIQNLAVGYLCRAAKKTANISRAKELVKSMPDIYDSQEILTEYLLEGDDKKSYIKDVLYALYIQTISELCTLAKSMPKDIVSLLYKKVEMLNNALYGNDDLVKWSPLGSSLLGWAQRFAEAEDNDMAFELLNREIERRHYITKNQPANRFSFLSPQYMTEQVQNRSLSELKEWCHFSSEEDISLLNSYPESFQLDPRFKKIVAEFRKLQKELTE